MPHKIDSFFCWYIKEALLWSFIILNDFWLRASIYTLILIRVLRIYTYNLLVLIHTSFCWWFIQELFFHFLFLILHSYSGSQICNYLIHTISLSLAKLNLFIESVCMVEETVNFGIYFILFSICFLMLFILIFIFIGNMLSYEIGNALKMCWKRIVLAELS